MPRAIYLFRDTYNMPKNHHKLARHTMRLQGVLTPRLFQRTVVHSFNTINANRGYSLYAGTMVNGRPHMIAKLYLIHSNFDGRNYNIFSTFYKPDGEIWRIKAGLSQDFFERSTKDYPSRPPFNPLFNNKIRDKVSG
jgi:hypothetical protein